MVLPEELLQQLRSLPGLEELQLDIVQYDEESWRRRLVPETPYTVNIVALRPGSESKEEIGVVIPVTVWQFQALCEDDGLALSALSQLLCFMIAQIDAEGHYP